MPQPVPGKTRLKPSEMIVPSQLPSMLPAMIVLRRINDPAVRLSPPPAVALLPVTVTLVSVTVVVVESLRPPPLAADDVLPLRVTLVMVSVAVGAPRIDTPPPPVPPVAVL